ncbi:NAD-dependent epimerase/dehydratase family protein [Ottowia sp. GY511]|uniref:NAD-dependent epimerase/dehydratase family protein n=1 Tax=Ottowia flava TaxID=2675430 RepID=A0ABW4KY16_9BURK|nr:NAD-dependent epimerase/dehydratase family protein [Ottowia sp. GY511]TXK26240.1 NAD-dependent epimerase/dehydratase family protein [Ottowia sp. GY511]
MPSNLFPLGALPSRFRRARVLIVGYGDVGVRVARLLAPRVRLAALVRGELGPSDPGAAGTPERPGVTAVQRLRGDLDDPVSLRRLAGVATHVVHLAPPPAQGGDDARTAALLRALARRTPPRALVYASTSGVYGDCAGALVSETTALRPLTPRAARRVAAERRVRDFGRRAGVRASVLRIPGIYAPDRAGGTPRARLLAGTPVLAADDDVYTNHIHADDLARACVLALWRGLPLRTVNTNDDSQLKMGEYFDLAADLLGLDRPPRVARAWAMEHMSPTLLSFMSESRRLDNTRLKRELGLRLRHASPASGLLEKK